MSSEEATIFLISKRRSRVLNGRAEKKGQAETGCEILELDGERRSP